MSYSLKQLSELSGVSTDRLSYYEEVELLKPASYADNGYRFYEEEQLLFLQQILLFQELGYELEKIRDILYVDTFSKTKSLSAHRKCMEQELARYKKLIETIDKTAKYLKDKDSLAEDELFDGFNGHEQEDMKAFIKTLLDDNK